MNPLAWWNAVPATARAAVKSYCVAALLVVQSTFVGILGVGYALGKCGTPHDTLIFVGQVWWTALLGIILGVGPYYRASQGAQRVKSESPGP